MKKILLLAAFSLCVTGSFAQKLKLTDDALDKKVLAVNVEGANLATIEMEKELSLNQVQQQEVEMLNKVLYNQLFSVKEANSEDEYKQAVAIRKIQLENDKALKRVLTEQQLKKYLELEGRQYANQLSELDEN